MGFGADATEKNCTFAIVLYDTVVSRKDYRIKHPAFC